jgi:hypothetical protein
MASIAKEGDQMDELKTDQSLLTALRRASSQRMTPEEARQQRVSFVMGTVKEDSGVTRAKVEEILSQQEGGRAA